MIVVASATISIRIQSSCILYEHKKEKEEDEDEKKSRESGRISFSQSSRLCPYVRPIVSLPRPKKEAPSSSTFYHYGNGPEW